jgi:hypothetical protein
VSLIASTERRSKTIPSGTWERTGSRFQPCLPNLSTGLWTDGSFQDISAAQFSIRTFHGSVHLKCKCGRAASTVPGLVDHRI